MGLEKRKFFTSSLSSDAPGGLSRSRARLSCCASFSIDNFAGKSKQLCPRYIRSFLCFVQVKHGVGVRRGLRAANHNGGKFILKAFLTESSFACFKFRQNSLKTF